MEGLLVYYPLIFVLFFFVSGCVICYKYDQQHNYSQKEQDRKQSQYNLDRLMNNHNHCVSEEQIVANLKQYDIQYRPQNKE